MWGEVLSGGPSLEKSAHCDNGCRTGKYGSDNYDPSELSCSDMARVTRSLSLSAGMVSACPAHVC